MKHLRRGHLAEITRAVACVAIAALVAQVAPHVVSFNQFASGDPPPAGMPIAVRLPTPNGAKQRLITRHAELEGLRSQHPDLSLLLDTSSGRIAHSSERVSTFKVEEFPRGQIITLELRDANEYVHARYKVEGYTVTPLSMRLVRTDDTTYLLLAGLVTALVLGRIGTRRRLQPAMA